MLSRFRPWQLCAILILICVAGVAVVKYYTGRGLTTAQLIASLPAVEGLTLFIDVAALRDAGILEQLVGKQVNEDQEYRDFVARSGFDYKSDLNQVMMKYTRTTTYLVLNGRFDWRQLIQYARETGGSCRNALCRMPASRPDRFVSFYPIRREVMALAVGPTEEEVSAVKLRTAPGQTVPTDPFWIRTSGAALQNSPHLPEGTRQFARLLGDFDSVVLRIGPDRDQFRAGLEVDCRNAEEAAVLKTKLEQITSMLQKMIAQEKQSPNLNDLSGVLTGGKFERNGRQVIGTWPVQRGFLNSLGRS